MRIAMYLLFLFAATVTAMHPLKYRVGDNVKLRVNKLTSLQTLFPLSHYNVPFCQPQQGVKGTKQNLGQHLTGDEIRNSPYQLSFGIDLFCEVLCVSHLGRSEKKNQAWQQQTSENHMLQAIHQGFRQNWLIGDGLPAAWRDVDDGYSETNYVGGFPLGFVGQEDNRAYIYNHVNLIIEYHPVHENDGDDEEVQAMDVKEEHRIVRFTVQPFSVKHKFQKEADTGEIVFRNPTESCKTHASEHTNFEQLYKKDHAKPQLASGEVLFTYDVIWVENLHVHWSDRWEVYLMNDRYASVAHCM